MWVGVREEWVGKLAVRPSAVHGRGLFALCDIPIGKTLGRYVGKDVSFEDVCKRYKPNQPSFVFQVGGRYIDGADDSSANVFKFLNDYRGSGRTHNVVLTYTGCIKTRRRIAEGEELLVTYGPSFWRRSGL